MEDIRTSFKTIREENVDKKIERYNVLIKKSDEMSLLMSKAEIDRERKNEKIEQLKSDLVIQNSMLEEMKIKNQKNSNVKAKLIKNQILKLEKETKDLDKERTLCINKSAKTNAEIDILIKNRDEFEKVKKDLRVYDMIMQAMSKKGIPLQIMSNQLPVINLEISKILRGVVEFTVEVESDMDSNSMDVYINYGDSKRIAELGSGMEKMIASLAIRVALINISSLPKTNMLIIDEGFGSLDETNLEACGRLLESLKKWFRNILIISHVDAIKDTVDNNLDIIKSGKDARIYYD